MYLYTITYTHTHTPTHMSHSTPNRVKSKTYDTCEAQNSRKNSSLEIMLKMVLENLNYFLLNYSNFKNIAFQRILLEVCDLHDSVL